MAYNNVISVSNRYNNITFNTFTQKLESNAIKFYGEIYGPYIDSISDSYNYTLGGSNYNLQNYKVVHTNNIKNFCSIYGEIPISKADVGKTLKMNFSFKVTSSNYDYISLSISQMTIPSDWFNEPPTINGGKGGTTDLGNKNAGFSINYTVNDPNTSDTLTVLEYLNGNQIRNISNAPKNSTLTINISKEQLYSLPLNTRNTITISVNDNQGEIVYQYYTFVRTNTPPTITSVTTNLGTLTNVPLTLSFAINDVENDTNMNLSIFLDNILIDSKTNISNNTNSYSVSLSKWLTIKNGSHKIRLTIQDSIGAANSLEFTFIKNETTIQSDSLTNIIKTDILATKIVLLALWNGYENIDQQNSYIKVCNNAYDTTPVWEDVLTEVLSGNPHTFSNTTKTATNAGINLKFKLVKKSGVTANINLQGIGGAFE